MIHFCDIFQRQTRPELLDAEIYVAALIRGVNVNCSLCSDTLYRKPKCVVQHIKQTVGVKPGQLCSSFTVDFQDCVGTLWGVLCGVRLLFILVRQPERSWIYSGSLPSASGAFFIVIHCEVELLPSVCRHFHLAHTTVFSDTNLLFIHLTNQCL